MKLARAVRCTMKLLLDVGEKRVSWNEQMVADAGWERIPHVNYPLPLHGRSCSVGSRIPGACSPPERGREGTARSWSDHTERDEQEHERTRPALLIPVAPGVVCIWIASG